MFLIEWLNRWLKKEVFFFGAARAQQLATNANRQTTWSDNDCLSFSSASRMWIYISNHKKKELDGIKKNKATDNTDMNINCLFGGKASRFVVDGFMVV